MRFVKVKIVCAANLHKLSSPNILLILQNTIYKTIIKVSIEKIVLCALCFVHFLLNLQIKVQSYKKIYKNNANCNHNFISFIDYPSYFVE